MGTENDASKVEIVDEIVGMVRERVPQEQRAAVTEFVRQYFAGVAAEDLEDSSTPNLYGAALAHWNFARKRVAGAPKLRVYNPQHDQHGWQSTHTIIEIVADDMPFLVDSVRMAVNRHQLTVHLIVHPVIRMRRDADGVAGVPLTMDEADPSAVTEAVMHIEVDRQTEESTIDALVAEIESVLDDVRAAVDDWKLIRGRLTEVIAEVRKAKLPIPDDRREEGLAFLEWIDQDHFTFLAYRAYELREEGGEALLSSVAETGLGLLRKEKMAARTRGRYTLPPALRKVAQEPDLLIVTKANSRSTVHRSGYLDYVGVKRFDADGRVVGEDRFLGLYTSAAYNRSPRSIPLLRERVSRILARAGYPANSHAAKALLNILENFPRDELFQIQEDSLYETSMGILHLQERQRIRLFVHRDRFGRFYSCIVYVPRERFNTQARLSIQAILDETFRSRGTEFTVQLGDSVLARLHFVLRVDPEAEIDYDALALEQRLREVTRVWTDDLTDALFEHFGEEKGTKLQRRYAEGFKADYREGYSARVAVHDIEHMEALSDDKDSLAMSLYRPLEAGDGRLRFKLFHLGRPISLSEALPMLENMGLEVEEERPSTIARSDGRAIYLHDFGMLPRDVAEVDLDEVRGVFQDAFARIWFGDVENDGFNRLVLRAGLSWREIVILRACAKYLKQTGTTFSQEYMEHTLVGNAEIARLLVDLFHARFDPGAEDGRAERAEAIVARIRAGLDAVANLDEDRILRSFLGVVQAMLRTNYHQTDDAGELKSYVSFKFDPDLVPELPEPRPMYEIFVYSPRIEGVHLRGGPVARGGLRWSDRREDFRTEVLGLVKAQMVKNAVIVPVGSKGGFVPKRLPSGDREAVQAEGIACYSIFIRGLLDITDNIVGGRVEPPADVVRHDGDDPYLVVAADKGTATFSDIANGIAVEYGFWLGDAFASGGSAGYDHKGMGITARGAWESVKRQFRELGTDIQTTDFTVVGIGDMAGDVFGNGMLLSEHIRLVGAFNHMHIFLDPEPDAARSFKERQRMFKLPRSSWADYDTKLISKGGGIWPRSAKSIALSPEVRARLDVSAQSLTPNELMRAMLRAPVDLLWNGGIGTYVKASYQTDAEVGDRANDALRVDATDLRCRVIGEGGNLGFTQLGRIEFAAGGGRMYTDAIDNSAGVDCSDHEVNIKILLNAVVTDGDMTRKQRDKLLAEMTDEVGDLVLRDNYLQTQALAGAASQSPAMLDVHARLIRRMERDGALDRAIEFLPAKDEIEERAAAGRGLTTPELAVLIAYVKIQLFHQLLLSDLPDDPYLQAELVNYFPVPLRKRYRDRMGGHRLWREIIGTQVSNGMVNRAGITYAFRLGEETGADAADVARAYMVARDVFRMEEVWAEIESLDNRATAQAQIQMQLEARKLVERAARWLLRNRPRPFEIAETVERFAGGYEELSGVLRKLVPSTSRTLMDGMEKKLVKASVPAALAKRIAEFNELFSLLDIVEVSGAVGVPVREAAGVYFALGAKLQLSWLRDRIVALPRDNRWQALARAALRDDLYAQEAALAADVLRHHDGKPDPDARIDRWVKNNSTAVARCQQVIADLRSGGSIDFTMLSVAMGELRALRQVETVPAAPSGSGGAGPTGRGRSKKGRAA